MRYLKGGLIVFMLVMLVNSIEVKGAVMEQEKEVNEEVEIDTNQISLYVAESKSGVWINENGLWWYRHDDGSYTTNDWEKIDGHWYHFSAKGWMQKGWVKYDGIFYYLKETSPNQGIMVIGWQKIKDHWYYFKKESPNQGAITYPDGRIKFNTYTLDGKGNSSLINVCMHELGHALGLSHNESSDVMYEYMNEVSTLTRNDKESYLYRSQEY